MSLEFEIVDDRLIKYLRSLGQNYRKPVKKALGRAIMRAWHDVVYENPRPHVDTGYTRGSVSIYAGGEMLNRAQVLSARGLNPTAPPPPDKIASNGLDAVIAVISPYAARLHELRPDQLGPRSIADGNVGPKFVEQKLLRHRDEYMKIIADGVRDALHGEGGGGSKSQFSQGIGGTQ